ncbi:MAG: hypothetical protein RMK43_13035, partial [Cyclobacteriaceae bacterium]|nr:hypothetical protein [Cyclobacteriaceae bacterium]
NPILLLIGLPQAAYVFYWFLERIVRQKAWKQVAFQALWLAGAMAAAAVLLFAEVEYVGKVRSFNKLHQELINWHIPPSGAFFYLHNIVMLSAFISALFVGAVFSRLFRGTPEPSGVHTIKAVSQLSGLIWLGLFLLVLPQLFIVIVDSGSNRSMFTSRYLIYTQLGAIMLLTGILMLGRNSPVRTGILMTSVIVIATFGAFSYGRGIQLDTGTFAMQAVEAFRKAEAEGLVQATDTIIYRSGFLESDLFPDGFNDEVYARLKDVSIAPWITLYPTQKIRQCIVVPLSNRYGMTYTGSPLFLPRFYQSTKLRNELESGRRWWVLDWASGKSSFANCILPQLANLLDSDLLVYRDPASE